MKKENGEREEEEKEEDWKILKKEWRWRWRRWRCWWRQETGGWWRRWQIQNEHQLIPIFKKKFFYTFFFNPWEWVLVISLRPSCVHLPLFEMPFLKAMVFNLFVCLLIWNHLEQNKMGKESSSWKQHCNCVTTLNIHEPKVLSMSHLPESSWEQSL